MTPSLLSLSLGLALTLGAYAPQQPGTEPLAPALETRVQALGKQLRCAVCQGLSVADSPSSMARAQLDKVRELVAAGRNDAEVRDYFVARYGEWVLLKPPASGINLAVWLGPAALLAIGAVAIARQFKKRDLQPGRSEAIGARPGASAESPDDPYLSAVRSELER